ncbi:polyprenyl synthetase family protein [Streptomyces yunnanensis]|uniref:Polyprenyl synthetase family protein n=1 Tax=Streptomyces yunnanensis TaxID=156453 RepID=A0ABY8ANG3_9ACTN|nr:polyprenyl synthetase family protein [Streptomyces yunnanensis]WEB45116.1 polyprenyl synthetase family protein [Streptomyces yunnanensis]
MTATVPVRSSPTPPDLDGLRHDVDTVLRQFLQEKTAAAAARNLPDQAARTLEEFLSAGVKRLRPMLCALGWQAATATPLPKPVVRVAAGLEMFHAFCLIHDDIIDDSATRRGAPTVHRTLAAHHAAHRPGPLAERLGTSCALLIGDLALTWADELVHTAGLTHSQLTALQPVLNTMRTEVIYGQYLDVTATGCPTPDLERALAIIRYKTAKYTCESPLHIGAVLGGAPARLLRELTDYAVPLGEAFQLRDDLLGVFGNPKVTGKSHVEDLREGKHTMLVALALRDASPAHATVLRRLIGNPHLTAADATQIRNILTVTGARTHVENMISERRARALHLLGSARTIRPAAQNSLRRLAEATTKRTA